MWVLLLVLSCWGAWVADKRGIGAERALGLIPLGALAIQFSFVLLVWRKVLNREDVQFLAPSLNAVSFGGWASAIYILYRFRKPAVPQRRTCKGCSQTSEDDATFCQSCGARF